MDMYDHVPYLKEAALAHATASLARLLQIPKADVLQYIKKDPKAKALFDLQIETYYKEEMH